MKSGVRIWNIEYKIWKRPLDLTVCRDTRSSNLKLQTFNVKRFLQLAGERA